MDSETIRLAIAIHRRAGDGLVAFESFEDGSTTDPEVVHVAAAFAGAFLDDDGLRSFAEVVGGLYGATFRTRRITIPEAMVLAVAAPQRMSFDLDARAEVAVEAARATLVAHGGVFDMAFGQPHREADGLPPQPTLKG